MTDTRARTGVTVEYMPTPNGVARACARFREAAIANTVQIADDVFVDFAADGQPVGIELLHPHLVFDGPPRGVSFELVDVDGQLD
jgi:hypothetical protein